MFDRIVAQLNAVDLRAMSLDGLQETAAGVKRTRAALDALEARLLTTVADRTFDPAAGLEMLRASGGCSQREARRRLRRAEALDEMPAVADALSEGDITAEHADALAQAARSTSPEAVDSDTALLDKAKALPADLAAREVTDWTNRRQTIEDREAKFRRQRAMRSHRAWNDAEGMVNFRTRLDPVTGAQARAVIDDIANRLYRADGGRDAKTDQTRTWDQRNADALTAALGINPIPTTDTATGARPATNPANTGINPGGRPGTDRHPPAKPPGEDHITGINPGGRPGTDRHPPAEPPGEDHITGINPGGGPGTDSHPPAEPPDEGPGRGAGAPGRGVARGPASAPPPAPTAPVTGPAGRNNPQSHVTGPAGRNNPQSHVTGPAGGDRPGPSLRNQILVIAHTDAITGTDPDARCEIPGTGPIPRSELERLACEAELFGALFSRGGLPLWHGRRTRTVTPQQWRMLIARDRGCVLCAAGPSHCHAHHIVAWTSPAKGPTDIDNLVLVCNRHHHHIHQHHLTLTRNPNGQWATHTPNNQKPTRPAQPRAARPAPKPADRNDKNRAGPLTPDPASPNSHTPAAKPPAAIRAGP